MQGRNWYKASKFSKYHGTKIVLYNMQTFLKWGLDLSMLQMK